MILKELPEDFFVKEIVDLDLESSGIYSYFILRKREKTTFDSVKEISNALHIPVKKIGFAGNKDKKAITEQYISIYKGNRKKVEALGIRNVKLSYVGNGKERINLGDLKENSFRIVVRDLKSKEKLSLDKFKNYFDEQRFGVEGKNHLIGKLIIKRKFKEVCELLNLEVEGNNYVSSLRDNIGKSMLLFYIHSYQSYLWNLFLSRVDGDCMEVPIIGYLTELKGKVWEIYGKILEEEDVVQKDFLIKEMPELSCEGSERRMYEDVKDFSCKWEKDDIHEKKFKAILSFSLRPGAYATMAVKQLFSKDL